MEQAADILKHVETPLQLAAVALLAFYGITKAVIATNRWTPSDKIITLLLNRAFVLGLLVLVLAVGGPLLLQSIDRDDLIDGSVYGPDGSAIRNASVSAPPVGGQPVRIDGSFELRVPDHRRRDQYVVTASAEGFKSESRTVSKSAIGSVDFQLQPQPLAPEHPVRTILPDLVVGQFYGLPIVVVSMQVKSPGTTQSWISEITAQLSNEHLSVSLFPQFVTTLSNMGPYIAVTGLVPINPGLQTTIRFLMAPNADFNTLNRSVSNLPDYAGRTVCAQSSPGSFTPLTDPAFDLVQSFAQNKFLWTEGEWTLRFKITAGDQQDTFEKTFKLSSVDVQNLRASVKLLKSCLSFSANTPLAQDGATSNYLIR